MSGIKSSKRKDMFHSNATVGSVEKKLSKEFGLPGLKFRNSDGRDTRSDKKLKNYRKDCK